MLLTNLNIGSHEKSCIVKEVKIFLPCHQVLNLNLITFGSVFLTGSLSLSSLSVVTGLLSWPWRMHWRRCCRRWGTITIFEVHIYRIVDGTSCTRRSSHSHTQCFYVMQNAGYFLNCYFCEVFYGEFSHALKATVKVYCINEVNGIRSG